MKPLKSYIAYVPMFELEEILVSAQAIWNFMGPVSQVLILRNLGTFSDEVRISALGEGFTSKFVLF